MKVEKIDIQKWNTYLEQCPSATFFHSPDWYELWKKYKGLEYEVYQFNFPSGNSAILPLAQEKKHRNLFTHTISSPAGTYGGPVTNDTLINSEIESIEKFIAKYQYITIRNNPLHPILKNVINKTETTQIIDLRPGWKAVFEKWSDSHRRAVKKSLRDEIEFRPAQKNEWKAYFAIYQETLQRWDQPPARPYRWELFELMRDIANKKCILWLALKDGKPIAGILCFYYQEHVVYWHGASLEAYHENKPVQGLQYHIIMDAIRKDFKWYDFNPSGGHEGVVNFKKGFGATFISADVYSKTPRIIRMLIP